MSDIQRVKSREEQGFGYEGQHIALKGISRILAAQPESFQAFLEDNANLPLQTMVALIEGFPRIAVLVGTFYRAKERLRWYATILERAKCDGERSPKKRWAAGVLRRGVGKWIDAYNSAIELVGFWAEVADICLTMGSQEGVAAARGITATIVDAMQNDQVV
jgi:hypothetical protein